MKNGTIKAAAVKLAAKILTTINAAVLVACITFLLAVTPHSRAHHYDNDGTITIGGGTRAGGGSFETSGGSGTNSGQIRTSGSTGVASGVIETSGDSGGSSGQIRTSGGSGGGSGNIFTHGASGSASGSIETSGGSGLFSGGISTYNDNSDHATAGRIRTNGEMQAGSLDTETGICGSADNAQCGDFVEGADGRKVRRTNQDGTPMRGNGNTVYERRARTHIRAESIGSADIKDGTITASDLDSTVRNTISRAVTLDTFNSIETSGGDVSSSGSIRTRGSSGSSSGSIRTSGSTGFRSGIIETSGSDGVSSGRITTRGSGGVFSGIIATDGGGGQGSGEILTRNGIGDHASAGRISTDGEILAGSLDTETGICGSADNAQCGDFMVGSDGLKVRRMNEDGTPMQGSGNTIYERRARTHIRADSIGSADIAVGGVTSSEIKDGAITANDLSSSVMNTISRAHLDADDSISTRGSSGGSSGQIRTQGGGGRNSGDISTAGSTGDFSGSIRTQGGGGTFSGRIRTSGSSGGNSGQITTSGGSGGFSGSIGTTGFRGDDSGRIGTSGSFGVRSGSIETSSFGVMHATAGRISTNGEMRAGSLDTETGICGSADNAQCGDFVEGADGMKVRRMNEDGTPMQGFGNTVYERRARTHIRTDSIGSGDIAEGGVTSSEIADGTITANDLDATVMDTISRAHLTADDRIRTSGGSGKSSGSISTDGSSGLFSGRITTTGGSGGRSGEISTRNDNSDHATAGRIRTNGEMRAGSLDTETGICGSADNAQCGDFVQGSDGLKVRRTGTDFGDNRDYERKARTHIRADSIGSADIAEGGVTSSEIKDGTITANDLDSTVMDMLTSGANGNQGIQGVAGAAGQDGADGAQGAQGIQGVAGAAGRDGTDGAQGAKGDQGMQGVAGANGQDGADGTQGDQGAQGIQGAAGAVGQDGADGAQGAQGEQGMQGVAGANGQDGAQGAQGMQGVAGAAGQDGAQGAQGIQGVAGATGQDGADGTQGDQGIQGVAGANGQDGADGTQGDQGAQGIQGVAGANGQDGAQGAQGMQGVAGANGQDGADGAQGVAGAAGQDGEGLMAGGQEGQILAKSSNADFDAEWVDAPVGGVLQVNTVSTEIVRDRAITAEKIAPNAIVVRGSAARRFSDEIAQAAQTGGVFEAQIVPGSIGFADFGAEVNQAFSRIEGDIDRLDEAVAMSGAMSMMEIPQGNKFGVSVGVGNYQSREAMAFGVGFRPVDNVLIKVGGAYGFDSKKVLTAGSLSIGF